MQAFRNRGGFFSKPEELAVVEAMVTTNFLGPIRLTAALLPQLQGQKNATILNVTSDLAFLPGAFLPTYSATKAAMHAYTLALRPQIRGKIDVLEVIPPYVQTELGPNHGKDPRAMPLNNLIGAESCRSWSAITRELRLRPCRQGCASCQRHAGGAGRTA